MNIDIKEFYKVSVECFDSMVVLVVSVVCEVVVVMEVVKVMFEKFDSDLFE